MRREFKTTFDSNSTEGKTFFLLKRKRLIISMGALWRVKPVLFHGEEFTIYALLNVISNVKGNGYGKRVVSKIRDYLVSRDCTGLGFCMPENTGFYAKCGFRIEPNSSKRFIHRTRDEDIVNQDGQFIFYQDSSDRFMEKVLSFPTFEVLIPTQNLW